MNDPKSIGAVKCLTIVTAAAVLPAISSACSDSFDDCAATRTCPPSDAGTRPDSGRSSTGGTSASGGSSASGGAPTAGSSTDVRGGAGGGTSGAAGASAGATTPSENDAGVVPEAGTDGASEGGLTCPAGFGDCNHRADDGCEVNLAKDVDHCGECGVGCSAEGTTSRACNDGVCSAVCDASHADCDKDGNNGCEVDTQSDAANCGACAASCDATGTIRNDCVTGICTPACAPGHANCDKNGKNGCELDTGSDAANCGACGTVCAVTGTVHTSCVAGICTPQCDGAHDNCDKDGKNGCEADLNSASTCGACGHGCLGGACSSRQCQAVVLAYPLPTPRGIAVDSQYVHWVDGDELGQSAGRLMRVALSGGPSTLVVSDQLGPYDAVSDGQYVYWSTSGDGMSNFGSIQRVVSGDNMVRNVASSVNYPAAVEGPKRLLVDAANVYFSADGGVYKVPKSGAGAPSAISGLSVPSISGLAMDKNYVYTAFLDLRRAAIMGDDTLLQFAVGDTLHIAVDDTYVYYGHQDSSAGVQGVYKEPKDFNGDPSLVATASILPTSPVVMDSTYIYYSDGKNLSRLPKAGGKPQALSNLVNNVFAIVVTKDAVYWSNTSNSAMSGSIMKLAL